MNLDLYVRQDVRKTLSESSVTDSKARAMSVISNEKKTKTCQKWINNYMTIKSVRIRRYWKSKD